MNDLENGSPLPEEISTASAPEPTPEPPPEMPPDAPEPAPPPPPPAPQAEAAPPPRPPAQERREPKQNDKREAKPPRPAGNDRPQGGDRGQPRQERNKGDERRPPREGGRPSGGGAPRGREGRPDLPADIDLDKLMADSLYLDNQAHAVVARMRDMDSGTRSQLRRFYSAVRRACRTADSERQHQFVMLRARLAYTIARHQLRSLDTLERLLLQVTRKNEPRGYERFRDLFEAIVAYNE